ncbi:MAG: hypothetical protein WCJ73_09395 [Actinomycetes bacterium]
MNLFRQDIDVDGSCLSLLNPRSVIDLSASNAELAGILAGFMTIALTTLLALKRDGSALFRFGVKHATVLLAVGIIILGIDAYLFGFVAATRPIEIDGSWPAAHSVCPAAWVDFMPASALLLLGAVVLVVGLSWIVVCNAEPKDLHWLATFSNYAIALITVGSLAFLTYGATIFIDEMHVLSLVSAKWRFPTLVVIHVYFLANFIYYAYEVVATNLSLNRKRNMNQPELTSSDLGSTEIKYDPDNCIRGKVLRATIGATIYMATAVIFTLLTPMKPDGGSAVAWDYIGYGGGIVLGVIGPGIVFYLVVRASPGLNEVHGLSPHIAQLP